jgi:hypothetical protein
MANSSDTSQQLLHWKLTIRNNFVFFLNPNGMQNEGKTKKKNVRKCKACSLYTEIFIPFNINSN